MLLMHCVAVVVLLLTLPTSFGHDKPLEGRVAFEARVDKVDHYVGEPLILRLTFRNLTDAPIGGWFNLHYAAERTMVGWRRGGGLSFLPVELPPVGVDFGPDGKPIAGVMGSRVSSGGTLQPNTPATHTRVLLRNGKGYVLEAPGMYEFRVTYTDSLDKVNRSNDVLISNTVRVRVQPVPAHEKDAAAAFATRAVEALVMHRHVTIRQPEPGDLAQGREFIETYPDSQFTPYVEEGFFRSMLSPVIATHAERADWALFEALQAARRGAKP